jgi:hypothetical protein
LKQKCTDGLPLPCMIRSRHQQKLVPAQLQLELTPESVTASSTFKIGHVPWHDDAHPVGGTVIPSYVVRTKTPLRAATPGQFLAAFSEDMSICHGGGTIRTALS